MLRPADAALNISDASGIAIGGGGGTTLWFAPGKGVLLTNCTDTTVHTFTLDYKPLPFVFGTVTATTASTTTVQLDPSSLTFEVFQKEYPPHDTWPPVTVFDADTSDRLKGLCSWGKAAPATLISGSSYSIACPGTGLKHGDIVVAATRVGFTVALSYTARVTMRDIVIHAAGNMALTEFQGDGGNVYSNISLVPRDKSRPLGSNADGFHRSACPHPPTSTHRFALSPPCPYVCLKPLSAIVACTARAWCTAPRCRASRC